MWKTETAAECSEVRKGAVAINKRVVFEIVRRARKSDRKAGIIDPDCGGKSAAERANVGHNSSRINKSVGGGIGRGGFARDYACIIDTKSRAKIATQGAKVSEWPARIKKSVRIAIRGGRFSDHHAGVVDRKRRAVITAE